MSYPPPDGSARSTPGYQGPYYTPQPKGYQAPPPRQPGEGPAQMTRPSTPPPPNRGGGGFFAWLARLFGRRG